MMFPLEVVVITSKTLYDENDGWLIGMAILLWGIIPPLEIDCITLNPVVLSEILISDTSNPISPTLVITTTIVSQGPSFLIKHSQKRFESNREKQKRKLETNTKQLSKGLTQIGYEINSTTHIIPIIIGTEKSAIDFGKFLFNNGVFAQPIRYPTVPKNQARLRISVTAWLSKKDIESALSVLETAVKKFKIKWYVYCAYFSRNLPWNNHHRVWSQSIVHSQPEALANIVEDRINKVNESLNFQNVYCNDNPCEKIISTIIAENQSHLLRVSQ